MIKTAIKKKKLNRTIVKKNISKLHTLLYLFQFLGNAHACVDFLSAFSEFGLIVFQKVASGQLRSDKMCQRWLWNNIRAPC